MIFRAIASSSFHESFDLTLVLGTLAPLPVVFGLDFVFGKGLRIRGEELGSFLQISFHGNLGYMGLAVAFYALGPQGFAAASILAGFLIICQNLLAVIGLQWCSEGMSRGMPIGKTIKKVLVNPIIFSAIGGILFSLAEHPLPEPIEKALQIISSMALPLALLLIGASLSFESARPHLKVSIVACVLKLLVLPGLGLVAYRCLSVPRAQFMPGLVLLASPTATVSYIMAGELGGSPALASSAISVSTILSAFTYLLWLGLY